MCGIVACIGADDGVSELVTALKNLEYRGYDSAGVAIRSDAGLSVYKQSGQISELQSTITSEVPTGHTGIGHTRWSTHGPPTDENAHPHTGSTESVAVVHNGIIENYEELRSELTRRGREFTSDTDTEVVPHLIEEQLQNGASPKTAFRRTVDRLEGSYALAAMVEGNEGVLATRQESPLVLGIGVDEYYLASDVPAFLEFTDEVVYLEDGDVAEVRPDGVDITDTDGVPVSRGRDTVDWDAEETGKGKYDHYMRKEIETQPDALKNTISGRISDDQRTVTLDSIDDVSLKGVEEVHLVGCGTSFHAAVYGQHLMNRVGVPAHAIRANEYTDTVPVDDGTLVVAVTQSGETADTLGALRVAERSGARTLALTNVTGSTAARTADHALFIRAGPEIGVAATKTFSSQAVSLTMLAHQLADGVGTPPSEAERAEFLEALSALPDQIDEVLDTSRAAAVSRKFFGQDAYFFIGHRLGHPVALEGALKFKEITYEHAEGFAAGQLKHGPLALVTPDTTVFAVFTGEDDERTRSNAKEAQARGADIIAVGPESAAVGGFADERLTVPETHPELAGLLSNIQLQLVSYQTAKFLDRPIDKPRNLAKSVTVK